MGPRDKVNPLMTIRIWVGGFLVMLVGLLFSFWFIPLALLGLKKLARTLHPLWAKTTLFCLGARLTTHGLERLPKTGFIAAATHHSLMDTFTYPAVIGAETCYVGKEELKRRPVFATCFRLLDNVYVRRDAGEKALDEILEHIQKLPDAHNVFIHPEGTRGPEGKVRPLTPGIIKLAIETQKPIVPMVSLGGEPLWPKGSIFPEPGPVSIIIGEPIHTEHWKLETYGTHLDALRKALHQLMKNGANANTMEVK